MRRWLRLQKQFPEVPILFAGDLNGYAGKASTDPEFKAIYSETDLQDVLEVASVSLEKRSTFFQIKNGGKAEGKQIDFCFIPASLQANLKIDSTFVYKFKDEFGFALDHPKTIEEKSRLPSDHYPIFLLLKIQLFDESVKTDGT